MSASIAFPLQIVRCSPSSSDDDCANKKVNGNETTQLSLAEKMRQASKVRRDQESEEIQRLSDCLPLPSQRLSGLDKATVLRLATSYMHMQAILKSDLQCNRTTVEHGRLTSTQQSDINGNAISGQVAFRKNGQNGHHTNGTHGCDGGREGVVPPVREGELMLKALQGFVMFIYKSGTVTYVSEQVTRHTGIQQEEMIGHSLYGFVHTDDCEEIKRQFLVRPTCGHQVGASMSVTPTSRQQEQRVLSDGDVDLETFIPERVFHARLRCFVRKNGTKTRQSGYMLMHFSGRVKLSARRVIGLVALVRPMQSTPLVEIRLDGNMFLSRHSMDMMFTFCDPRIMTLVGYDPAEVIGKTAYQFHNPQDAPKVHKCHTNLIVRGTSVSKYYRFLGKTGQWVWMQTRATIICNTGNQPQYIACMNYIIGEEEGRRYLMMEQDDQSVRCAENSPGAIDITAIHSPTGSDGQTSGYGSADDEHLCSPGLPSPALRGKTQTQGLSGKTQGMSDNRGKTQGFNEPGLGLGDMDFMSGFLDGTLSPAPLSVVATDQTQKVSTSEPLGIQVSTAGQVNSPSMLSPSQQASFSPSRNTGFSLSDTFDNGDIEMFDTGSTDSSTNITVTLPSNVNLQGHDTKSLLLSILKNADKSELLKLNSQLTQALASIQAQGGSNGQPNIHISIESQPKSNTTASKTISSRVDATESFFSMSPAGESLMDTCDIFPTATTNNNTTNTNTVESSSSNSNPTVTTSNTCTSSVNLKMNDTMAAIFSDMDSSQFPEFSDVFHLTGTDSDITEQLLNDVNLGRSASAQTAAQTSVQTTATSQSYQRASGVNTVVAPKQPISTRSSTRSVVKSTVTQNHSHNSHHMDLAAAKRGLDDHSYFCSKAPASTGHVRFAPEGKTSRRPQGSVLEHFLTTKDPLNPMKGSDHAAHGLSKLHLEESQGLKPNLLKQLLTEDVGRRGCVQRLEACHSTPRKPVSKTNTSTGATTSAAAAAASSTNTAVPHSSQATCTGGSSSIGGTSTSSLPSGPAPTQTTSPVHTNTASPLQTTDPLHTHTTIPGGPLHSELGLEPGLAELDMLGTTSDMEALWTEEGRQEEELFLSSEIDEILREESRHQEEWMKEFLDLL